VLFVVSIKSGRGCNNAVINLDFCLAERLDKAFKLIRTISFEIEE